MKIKVSIKDAVKSHVRQLLLKEETRGMNEQRKQLIRHRIHIITKQIGVIEDKQGKIFQEIDNELDNKIRLAWDNEDVYELGEIIKILDTMT